MVSKRIRFLAAIMTAVIIIASIPMSVFANNNDDDFSVVMSIEGLTLGQGMYVEPKAYTLNEINTFLATEGYGPYEKQDLTAGMATLAMLIDNGLEYEITGNWESDAYISCIKNIDKGEIDIPSVIADNGGPSNDSNDGNDDDFLGEFDYASMSGWMITVNDLMIPVGCSQFGLMQSKEQNYEGYQDYGNTFVIRWHFTLWGYGADLGFNSGWGSQPYFDHVNKDMLYAEYAKCTDADAKSSALSVMENLTATQAQVDAALNELKAANSESSKPQYDVKTVLNATMAQMAVNVPEPVFASVGGEWTVISLARGGYYAPDSDYFNDYYNRIVETVNTTASKVSSKNGALHRVKSTENSRLILALTSIGKDPASVGDWNLIKPFDDFTWIKKQGINGPIFALIALDSNNYQTENSTIRQQCVDYILGKQLADGGWALSGTSADPDITSMALQSLAKYKSQPAVSEAANKAFSCLSSIQNDNGGYSSWGSVNSESIAQVIVACTAWGINPNTDKRFVKNGSSAVDALMKFYIESGHGFAHVLEDNGGYTGGEVNSMATDQACYALIAYNRFIDGKSSLYDMTDVKASETKEIKTSVSVPEKIENLAGTTFNAIINLDAWDANAGYKLIDCIVNVPSVLDVTDVQVGSRISGGQLRYNLESETGKLRIVYFDPQNGQKISVSGNTFPAEFVIISFKLKQDIDINETGSLDITLSDMTIKKGSDTDKSDSTVTIDTSNGSASVKVVKGITFSAMKLYSGDGSDLIPNGRTAVAVVVTGVKDGTKIVFNDGKNVINMRFSTEITKKTGVSTYVLMTDGDDISKFSDKANYTVSEETGDSIVFGDSNGDGIINAQDALAVADMWLRKSKAPNNDAVLALNVNGDERINTSDALAIVEHFVDGDEFAIVNIASAIKNEMK